MHAQIISSIKDLQLDGEDPRKLLQSWGRLRFPRHLLQKNKNTKHKQLIPKNMLDSRSLKFIVGLHDRTTKSLLHLHKKKRPPSISAQFQTSLSKLLETLAKAEPFFIRCLRSNAEKKEMCFDEALILQQLRYTGMLETVRIRRSGYGAKYTFQEFIEQFRVLLPKDASSPKEILTLLKNIDLDPKTYQIGKTKVYLKELERQKLLDTLHKDVMRKIVFLQRWFRAKMQRREFLQMRQAAIFLQRSWRDYRERHCRAAALIQAAWRGFKQRAEYQNRRASVTKIQALVRGQSARRRYNSLKEEKRKREEEEARRRKEEEEEAARQAQEAAEVARKAQEAEKAARQEREAAEAARRAQEEAKRQRDAEEAARREKEAEEVATKLSEQKAKKEAPDKQLNNQAVIDMRRQNDGSDLMQNSKEKESQQTEAGPQHEAELPAIQVTHEHDKSLVVLEKRIEDMGAVQEANKNSNIALPGKSSQNTAIADPTTTVTALPKTSPSVSAEEDVKRPQTGSHTTNTIHADPGQSRAPPMGKLPASRSQEKRELRRQRGLEHSQRESVRAAAAGKDQSCKELDHYTFISQKREKPKKEAEDEEEKVKKGAVTSPIRPSTLPLEVPASDEPKQTPRTKDVPSHGKSNTQPEITLKEPGRQEDKRTHMLKTSRSLDDVSEFKTSEVSTVLQPLPHVVESPHGGRASSMKRSPQDDGPHAHPHTPERSTGFFRKILKKRPHKEAQTPEDGDLTMAAALSEKECSQSITSSRTQHSEHPSGRLSRNPTIKISRATRVTEQWNASLDREITNANELQHLDEFLGNQVNDLRSRGKQLSAAEHIFITATMQFRENIKSMYSLSKPHIGYKGLMRSYQNKVISLASEQQKGEVQLVVNLFQSVLDGFIRGEIKREEAEPVKAPKGRKKRRKKDKNTESPLDHVFNNFQVNIMQSCDQCSSYIWVMEKAYMCSYCKLVCHKKCLTKIVTDCNTYCSKKSEEDSGSQHFGVRVCRLVSDKAPVPMVLELLLEHVEMNGLYTEGIYRKSGSANRMKELRQHLEADPNSVCLEDYPIHTVTGLVKQWLRELPEPLMTFNHYNDFLHAVELPEKQEQLQAIYRVIEALPTAHYQTLERLIFHLVRVSREEKSNRMTPNSLAIVFAPCILRGPDSADPLLSMKDVAKTTTCVEMLINEQMKRYIERLEEIEQLEYAETLAKNQLKLKRSNTSWPLPLRFTSPYKGVAVKEKPSDLRAVPENEPLDSDTEAERNLVERIKSIKQEKEDLVCRLPDMEQPGSDQENLDSEASASSESLLDDRTPSLDMEGVERPLLVPLKRVAVPAAL